MLGVHAGSDQGLHKGAHVRKGRGRGGLLVQQQFLESVAFQPRAHILPCLHSDASERVKLGKVGQVKGSQKVSAFLPPLYTQLEAIGASTSQFGEYASVTFCWRVKEVAMEGEHLCQIRNHVAFHYPRDGHQLD